MNPALGQAPLKLLTLGMERASLPFGLGTCFGRSDSSRFWSTDPRVTACSACSFCSSALPRPRRQRHGADPANHPDPTCSLCPSPACDFVVFVFTAIVDRYSDIIKRFKSVNLSLAPVVTTQFPSRRLTQIASACGPPRRILCTRAIPWVCGLTTHCWVPSFSSPCIFWRSFHISTQRSSSVLLSPYGIPLGDFTIVDVTSPLLMDVWVVQSFTISEEAAVPALGQTHHFSHMLGYPWHKFPEEFLDAGHTHF